jgi:xylonate dehydratase
VEDGLRGDRPPLPEIQVTRTPKRPFRSREWFHCAGGPDMAALHLERFMNRGTITEVERG